VTERNVNIEAYMAVVTDEGYAVVRLVDALRYKLGSCSFHS